MHHRGKLGGYPHLHVLEHQRAAGKALEAHPLPVRHAEAGGVLRRHVNVALGHNQAAAQAEHPVPVAEGEAGGALRIAGEAHRRGEPQGHRIGEGDLHLALRALRAQNHHVLQAPPGPLQCHPLGAGELPRLGQVFRPVEPVARAEQGLHIGPGQVDMPSAGLQLDGQAGDQLLRQPLHRAQFTCVHSVPPLT